jgi:hypothetical protein
MPTFHHGQFLAAEAGAGTALAVRVVAAMTWQVVSQHIRDFKHAIDSTR